MSDSSFFQHHRAIDVGYSWPYETLEYAVFMHVALAAVMDAYTVMSLTRVLVQDK